MVEYTTSEQTTHFAFLMGGGFVVFYVVIYGVLWLAAAIFGGLVKQDDEDASFFDGDGMG